MWKAALMTIAPFAAGAAFYAVASIIAGAQNNRRSKSAPVAPVEPPCGEAAQGGSHVPDADGLGVLFPQSRVPERLTDLCDVTVECPECGTFGWGVCDNPQCPRYEPWL